MSATMYPAIENTVQQELCQHVCSEYRGVDKLELGVFMAVIEMIRLQYCDVCGWPEVYNTLLTLLHQFNPTLGEQHEHQIRQCIESLLSRECEMAQAVLSWLPTLDQINSSPPHSLHIQPQQRRPIRIQRPLSTTSRKSRINGLLKYYNFTTPGIHAYLASRGKPARVTLAGTTEKFVAIHQKQPSSLLETSTTFTDSSVTEPGDTDQKASKKIGNSVVFHLLKSVQPASVRIGTSRFKAVKPGKILCKEMNSRRQTTVPIILKFSHSVKRKLLQTDGIDCPPVVNVVHQDAAECGGQETPVDSHAISAEICQRTAFPYSHSLVFPDGQKHQVAIINKDGQIVEDGRSAEARSTANPIECLQKMVENTNTTSSEILG